VQDKEIKQDFLHLCQDEVTPLAHLEWEESGHPTEPLCINWDAYDALEDMGMLKFFTVRCNKDLVGYCVVILGQPFTMKGVDVGYLDALYVSKEHRGIGKELITFVEKCLKEDGIQKVIASSSVKNPVGKFLDRLGYKEVETKYERNL